MSNFNVLFGKHRYKDVRIFYGGIRLVVITHHGAALITNVKIKESINLQFIESPKTTRPRGAGANDPTDVVAAVKHRNINLCNSDFCKV